MRETIMRLDIRLITLIEFNTRLVVASLLYFTLLHDFMPIY